MDSIMYAVRSLRCNATLKFYELNLNIFWIAVIIIAKNIILLLLNTWRPKKKTKKYFIGFFEGSTENYTVTAYQLSDENERRIFREKKKLAFTWKATAMMKK